MKILCLQKQARIFLRKTRRIIVPKYIELSAQTELNLSELFSSNKPKEEDNAKEEKDE